MLCSRRLLVAFLLQLRLHLQIPGYSTPLHQQVYFRALCVGRHGLLLHWSLAIRAIALRQRDAGRKTATLPVFVLSVLGLVSYVKGLWPAPVMGDLLLVHAPSLVLFQCLLIFIALVRHVHDSLLAPLGRPRIPAIAAPLIKRKALRVVLLHFVLELAPVHLRYHPAVPILVRVMATLARAVPAAHGMPWPHLPTQGWRQRWRLARPMVDPLLVPLTLQNDQPHSPYFGQPPGRLLSPKVRPSRSVPNLAHPPIILPHRPRCRLQPRPGCACRQGYTSLAYPVAPTSANWKLF